MTIKEYIYSRIHHFTMPKTSAAEKKTKRYAPGHGATAPAPRRKLKQMYKDNERPKSLTQTKEIKEHVVKKPKRRRAAAPRRSARTNA